MMNLFAQKGLNKGVNGPVTWGVSGGVDGYSGSVDTTPDSLTFPSGSSWEYGSGSGSNAYAQVTGITAAATLCVVYDTELGVVRYRVSSTAINQSDYTTNSGSYTNISSGGTFTVSNNQWIGLIYTDSDAYTTTVFVKNQNSVGTTLGSFVGESYFEPL